MPETSSPVEIRATDQLTEKDLYEALAHHAGWPNTLMRVIGAILIVGGFGALIAQQYAQAVVPIIVGTLLIFRLTLSARSMFKMDFANSMQTSMVATDSGVQFLNAKGNSNVKWDAFLRFSETSNLFMLYVQSNFFNIVPKRALSKEDASALRDMFHRHVVSKPAKRLDPRLIIFLMIVVATIILMTLAIYRIKHSAQ